MSERLSVLMVEDNSADADLVRQELRREGYELEFRVVDDEHAYRKALADRPDVILADGSVPSFGASRALEILNAEDFHVPLIVVTGSISDERAVEYIKLGAADYLLKDRLARLGESIRQAMEKQRVENEFRRVQNEREQFFNLSLDLIAFLGFDGTFRLVNPAWESSLQWSATDLTGRSWLELVHPDDRDATAAEARKLVEGRTTVSFENRCLRRDGTHRWLSWRATPDRERNLIFASARDFTDARQLEEQFRQAQKMEAMGRLAGGVAHDFNNLLTVINGYSTVLLDEIPADHRWRPLLSEIRNAGERSAKLTRQLLAFSRKQVLSPQVLDLGEVVRSSEGMLRRLLGEDIDFRVEIGPDLDRVKADPGHVEQVLLNLAVNSRDAMPDGGHLTIAVKNERAGHRGVVLTVTDTGVGMDEATRARIFEPFFTTKGEQGTGLGLATVYGIVQQSGGWIDVTSRPGAGTTFFVHYHATEESPAAPAVVVERAPEKRGAETILLVEDDDHVRAFTRAVLQKHGYTILEARNGRDAIERAAATKEPIHLLVTDVVMPEVGGREAADGVLARHPETRVLFLSGYTDDAVLRHGVRQGEVAFLQKPYTPAALAKAARDLLES